MTKAGVILFLMFSHAIQGDFSKILRMSKLAVERFLAAMSSSRSDVVTQLVHAFVCSFVPFFFL